MFATIRAKQYSLGMSDAELLKFARSISGCARARGIEDLMDIELRALDAEFENIRLRPKTLVLQS